MIIKELNLLGFGKFEGKTLSLKEGINIIYGKNEAGKSTIHSFIDGIFYGFLKPYSRRKDYLEAHRRYQPWKAKNYKGSIKFSYKDEDYIIERDFTKDKEKFGLYIDATGEEISSIIDNDRVTRIPQAGYHFFGLNDAVYSNTISISQLGSKTKKDLARELRDRLANKSTSLDENLSVENALEDLNNSLKEIGSERAPRSNYGMAMKKLAELEKERERILAYREDYNLKVDEAYKLQKELKEAEHDLKILESRYLQASILAKSQIYREAMSLVEKEEEVKSLLKEYEKYRFISNDSYTEAISFREKLRGEEKRREDLEANLKESIEEIKLLESSIGNTCNFLSIKSDYKSLEAKGKERNRLLGLRSNESEFLKKETESKRSFFKTFKLIGGFLLLLSLAFVFLAIYRKDYIFVGLSAFLTCLALLFIILRLKSYKAELVKLGHDLEERLKEEKITRDKISQLEEEEEVLLSYYGLESSLEFDDLYERSRLKNYEYEEKKERIQIEEKRRDQLGEDLLESKKKIKNYGEFMISLLEDNGCKSIEELKEALLKKDLYKKYKNILENNQLKLDKILGDYRLIELEEEVKGYEDTIEFFKEEMDVKELSLLKEEKSEEIRLFKSSLEVLDGRLELLNRELVKLVEIEEEKEGLEKILEKMDMKRLALEEAIDTIESISKAIHRDFAPEINRKVASIIEKISDGKYRKIRLDDNLNISLFGEDGEILDLDILSGGTIDQLYFALRFGIIDNIGDKNPPLILDDSFIQYDDSRLKNMMDYLINISRERQVILFTCHKREFEILREKGEEFKLIRL